MVKKVGLTSPETGQVVQCELRMRSTDNMFNLRTLLRHLGLKLSHVLESKPVRRYIAFLKSRDNLTDDQIVAYIDGVPWGHWRLVLFVLATTDPAIADNNISFMACAAMGASVPRALVTQSRNDIVSALASCGVFVAGTRGVYGRSGRGQTFGMKAEGLIVVVEESVPIDGTPAIVLRGLETSEQVPTLRAVMEEWKFKKGAGMKSAVAVGFSDGAGPEDTRAISTLVKDTVAQASIAVFENDGDNDGDDDGEECVFAFAVAVDEADEAKEAVKNVIDGAEGDVAWAWILSA